MGLEMDGRLCGCSPLGTWEIRVYAHSTDLIKKRFRRTLAHHINWQIRQRKEISQFQLNPLHGIGRKPQKRETWSKSDQHTDFFHQKRKKIGRAHV